MKKYNIIYADPPWSYNDKMTGHSMSASGQYVTQSTEWAKKLPIDKIADKNCALFLWAVSPLLPEAIEVIKTWGFKYKTIAFCWSKRTTKDKIVKNLGRWTMGNIEICLLATKGKVKRIARNVSQLVLSSRGKHSEKPEEVRKRIVELLGDIPRIELFARYKGTLLEEEELKGWDLWGDEVSNDIELRKESDL